MLSPADELAALIRRALRDGDLPLAHDAAARGHATYPNHEDLRDLANLLAPPRAVGGAQPPNPGARLNRDWLASAAASAYRGRWVALRMGIVEATAATLLELMAAVPGDRAGMMLVRV